MAVFVKSPIHWLRASSNIWCVVHGRAADGLGFRLNFFMKSVTPLVGIFSISIVPAPPILRTVILHYQTLKFE